MATGNCDWWKREWAKRFEECPGCDEEHRCRECGFCEECNGGHDESWGCDTAEWRRANS